MDEYIDALLHSKTHMNIKMDDSLNFYYHQKKIERDILYIYL